jgi:hypothetical protein
MPRRAAATETSHHLSETAQEHLAALRREVEKRLAALEEVLTDPSRGESLAGLILDLSRVAVEEAQAAASQACLATRAEADKEITELRTSAKAAIDAAQAAHKSANAALEEERQAAGGLRKALDLAQREVQKQNELLAAREQLEKTLNDARDQLAAEVARQQSAAAEFERAAADARRQFETERAAAKEATDAAGTQLARERDIAAKHARALADAAAKLQEERAAGADLRKALEEAEERLSDLERAQGESQAADEEHQQLASDLEHARNEAAAHQKALAQAQRSLGAAQKELEAERAASANLRRDLERAEQLLSTARSSETQALAHHDQLAAERERERTEAARRIEALTAERDKMAGDLQNAMKWIDEHLEAEAEFSASSGTIRAAAQAAPTADAAPTAPAEEGWQAVRLATRFGFPEPIVVQVNGDPGKLVDISTTGCQLLFPTALKPNQVVKVQLPDERAPISCAGKVVWTRLEPPVKGGLMGYRAGVSFTKADGHAIEAFVARHAST